MDRDLQPRRADEGVGDLVSEVGDRATTMLRKEVELAKLELREDIRDAVAGISLFSAAGVAALIAAIVLSMSAGFGIATLLGDGWTWLGFLIVGVVLLVVAGIAALVGRKEVGEAAPPAPRSTRQAKQTAAAAKEIKL